MQFGVTLRSVNFFLQIGQPVHQLKAYDEKKQLLINKYALLLLVSDLYAVVSWVACFDYCSSYIFQELIEISLKGYYFGKKHILLSLYIISSDHVTIFCFHLEKMFS